MRCRIFRHLRVGAPISRACAPKRWSSRQEVPGLGRSVPELLHVGEMHRGFATGSVRRCGPKKTRHRVTQEDGFVVEQRARGVQLPQTLDARLGLHHGDECPTCVVGNRRSEGRQCRAAWGDRDSREHQIRGRKPSGPIRHDAARVFNPLQRRTYSVQTHGGGGIVRLGVRGQKASLQGTFGHPEELRDDGFAAEGQEPID